MANNRHREILVYAHWQGLGNPAMVGVLHATLLRVSEIFSFEYSKEWLNSGLAQHLDPDRWGRLLMKRREAFTAKIEKREIANLYESDFLLGVYDGHRMGALRFKFDEAGPFLGDNKKFASPPWASLKEICSYTRSYQVCKSKTG